MRALFVISDHAWSGRARAFVAAARALAERGHDVLIACEDGCPVQVRVVEEQLPVYTLRSSGTAGGAMQLRTALRERGADVVFVHSDDEQLAASAAMRLGRGAGVVIRRIPPFDITQRGRVARVASRMAVSGLLFSTDADRDAADTTGLRVPSVVAPPGVDPAYHDAVRPVPRADVGVPVEARLIVCVHDGVERDQVLSAMRTVSLLSSRHPELHLAVLGDVRQDDLRMHAAALGVTGRVTFLGARTDELAVLRAADVGWIASQGDAGAFAALDFMAFRVPVIAGRSPLMEHYVADGIAGVLLPLEEPPRTAAAVAAFLARENERIAMGRAGRTRLERQFPLEAMMRGFEEAAGAARSLVAQPA